MTSGDDPELEAARPGAPASAAPPRRRRGLRLSMFPTMLTLGNLVCGFLSLAYVADATGLFLARDRDGAAEKLAMAGWVILLGMVFDGLDGRVARLTRSTTNFGGALDSLADVVSFGVAPAMIGKTLVDQTLAATGPKMAFVTASFFAVCATLRLARYNVEHDEPDQSVHHFVGLPTPGAAGVLASLAICHRDLLAELNLSDFGRAAAANVIRFGLLTGLGLLMVSRVPYVHFANRFLSGRRPIGRIAVVLLVLALGFEFLSRAEYLLAALFLVYALSGPIAVIPRLLRRREEGGPELFE
jgi:CDP-diacylglycerol---serine O-phosphatidyltransferase